MKLILNQDVSNLGEEGDVVTVKDGYARNFLLPKKLAVVFNKENQMIFKAKADKIAKRKEEKRANAKSLKEKLSQMSLTVKVPTSESGKLFGSVTNTMIASALEEQGITIEKKKLEVPTQLIKSLGSYVVKVLLYEGESADLKVVVESSTPAKTEDPKAAKGKPRRTPKTEQASSEEKTE